MSEHDDNDISGASEVDEEELGDEDGFCWVGNSTAALHHKMNTVKNYKTVKHMKTYASHGKKAGQFLDPHGIAASNSTSRRNGDGYICVTDPIKNSLTVFRESTFRKLPSDCGTNSIPAKMVSEYLFTSVFDVAIHEASNTALVSDPVDKCIHCVSIDINNNKGVIIDGDENSLSSDLLFNETIPLPNCESLAGLCVTDGGLIGVLDSDTGRVLVLDGRGQIKYSFGEEGHSEGQFCLPQFICWDELNKRFIIADTANARIQVFTLDGRFLFAFGVFGFKEGGCFEYPSGVSTDDHGRIFVVDQGLHEIQIFDKDGHWLHSLGEPGALSGCFNSPKSLALLSNGDMIVTDNSNCRLQMFG